MRKTLCGLIAAITIGLGGCQDERKASSRDIVTLIVNPIGVYYKCPPEEPGYGALFTTFKIDDKIVSAYTIGTCTLVTEADAYIEKAIKTSNQLEVTICPTDYTRNGEYFIYGLSTMNWDSFIFYERWELPTKLHCDKGWTTDDNEPILIGQRGSYNFK